MIFFRNAPRFWLALLASGGSFYADIVPKERVRQRCVSVVNHKRDDNICIVKPLRVAEKWETNRSVGFLRRMSVQR